MLTLHANQPSPICKQFKRIQISTVDDIDSDDEYNNTLVQNNTINDYNCGLALEFTGLMDEKYAGGQLTRPPDPLPEGWQEILN